MSKRAYRNWREPRKDRERMRNTGQVRLWDDRKTLDRFHEPKVDATSSLLSWPTLEKVEYHESHVRSLSSWTNNDFCLVWVGSFEWFVCRFPLWLEWWFCLRAQTTHRNPCWNANHLWPWRFWSLCRRWTSPWQLRSNGVWIVRLCRFFHRPEDPWQPKISFILL